jgi:hypothetical protein
MDRQHFLVIGTMHVVGDLEDAGTLVKRGKRLGPDEVGKEANGTREVNDGRAVGLRQPQVGASVGFFKLLFCFPQSQA